MDLPFEYAWNINVNLTYNNVINSANSTHNNVNELT